MSARAEDLESSPLIYPTPDLQERRLSDQSSRDWVKWWPKDREARFTGSKSRDVLKATLAHTLLIKMAIEQDLPDDAERILDNHFIPDPPETIKAIFQAHTTPHDLIGFNARQVLSLCHIAEHHGSEQIRAVLKRAGSLPHPLQGYEFHAFRNTVYFNKEVVPANYEVDDPNDILNTAMDLAERVRNLAGLSAGHSFIRSRNGLTDEELEKQQVYELAVQAAALQVASYRPATMTTEHLGLLGCVVDQGLVPLNFEALSRRIQLDRPTTVISSRSPASSLSLVQRRRLGR